MTESGDMVAGTVSTGTKLAQSEDYVAATTSKGTSGRQQHREEDEEKKNEKICRQRTIKQSSNQAIKQSSKQTAQTLRPLQSSADTRGSGPITRIIHSPD